MVKGSREKMRNYETRKENSRNKEREKEEN